MTKPRRPRKPRKGADTGPAPHDSVTWADPDQVRSITWLWDQVIMTGASVMIEGKKGVGKSSIMAAVAAAVTGGGELPGWAPVERHQVLWEPREEDWDVVVVPRLVAARANVRSVGRPRCKDSHGRERRLTLPGDILILEETIRARDVRLLVLDPYSSVVGAGIDLRVAQQARTYAELVQDLMQRTGCVCLMSRHVVKGRVADARDAGLGSSEIGNVARVVIRCGEHPTERDTYVMSVVASSHAERRLSLAYRIPVRPGEWPRIQWLGEVSLSADEVAAGRGDEAENDEWSEADRLLCAVIGLGWETVGALVAEAERAGITPRMLRRAKARLRLPSRRITSASNAHWQWGPPPAGWPAGLTAPASVSGPHT